MELSDGSGVTYITFKVTNRGSIPTQVTHLHGYYYKSHWERIFFSKRRRSFIVPDNHIPKTIEPGAYWIFFAKQDGIKRKFGQNGLLYMGIVHSLKDKSILQRIRF